MQLVPRESFINSDNLFLYNLLRYIQRIVKVGGCSVAIGLMAEHWWLKPGVLS